MSGKIGKNGPTICSLRFLHSIRLFCNKMLVIGCIFDIRPPERSHGDNDDADDNDCDDDPNDNDDDDYHDHDRVGGAFLT